MFNKLTLHTYLYYERHVGDRGVDIVLEVQNVHTYCFQLVLI